MDILTETSNATSVVFSDVNPDVNIDSSFQQVYNVDSINKSIITILSTKKGSRVFNRNFGSTLQDLIFEPMDNITVDAIKNELINAVGSWEPRIVLSYAQVIPDFNNQQYYVELAYIIPQLNNRSFTFNFNLKG